MEGFSTPLVSVQWLSQHINNSNLIVLDATIPKVGTNSDTNQGKQILGARFFDIKKTFSNTNSKFPNTFPTAQQFQTEAQKLGITTNSYIVVYDDHGIYSSPRAWWLFKSFGHKNVAVLDGGLPAWISAELPVETPKSYAGKTGDFKANYQENSIKMYDEVYALIASKQTKILDARSSERFDGSMPEPREGLRSGHIPSSINLHYAELLNDGKMRSQDVLIKKFNEYKEQELVFSCGSGITACILALGAEVVGYKNISIYDGSWTEWGSKHELPIES